MSPSPSRNIWNAVLNQEFLMSGMRTAISVCMLAIRSKTNMIHNMIIYIANTTRVNNLPACEAYMYTKIISLSHLQ